MIFRNQCGHEGVARSAQRHTALVAIGGVGIVRGMAAGGAGTGVFLPSGGKAKLRELAKKLAELPPEKVEAIFKKLGVA